MDKEILIKALIEDGWFSQPHFLDQSFCERLLSDMQKVPMKAAGIGKGRLEQLNPDIRTDEISWLNENNCTEIQADYFKKMDELKSLCNQELYLGLRRFECHYAHYSKSGFYKKHLDQHGNSNDRVLSAITYLNTPATGGELIIYHRDQPEVEAARIKPEAGTLVCFLSNQIYHEVRPTQDDRFSLTGWFRTDVVI